MDTVGTTAPTPTKMEAKAGEPQCASHKRQLWNIDKSRFDWHRYCFADRPRLRLAALVGLVIIVLAVMILSIVFTAEYYTAYYATGAWIISKASNKTAAAQSNASVHALARHSLSGSCEGYMESCAQFNRPSICCAVGTACYATDLSPSGIYCCGNSSDCAAGPPREAVCLLGTTQCGAELGGGCCANAMDCSQDGCRIDQPQPSATDDSSMPEDTATSEATGSVTNKLGEVAPPNGGARWLATPSDATVAVLGAAWAAVVLL